MKKFNLIATAIIPLVITPIVVSCSDKIKISTELTSAHKELTFSNLKLRKQETVAEFLKLTRKEQLEKLSFGTTKKDFTYSIKKVKIFLEEKTKKDSKGKETKTTVIDDSKALVTFLITEDESKAFLEKEFTIFGFKTKKEIVRAKELKNKAIELSKLTISLNSESISTIDYFNSLTEVSRKKLIKSKTITNIIGDDFDFKVNTIDNKKGKNILTILLFKKIQKFSMERVEMVFDDNSLTSKNEFINKKRQEINDQFSKFNTISLNLVKPSIGIDKRVTIKQFHKLNIVQQLKLISFKQNKKIINAEFFNNLEENFILSFKKNIIRSPLDVLLTNVTLTIKTTYNENLSISKDYLLKTFKTEAEKNAEDTILLSKQIEDLKKTLLPNNSIKIKSSSSQTIEEFLKLDDQEKMKSLILNPSITFNKNIKYELTMTNALAKKLDDKVQISTAQKKSKEFSFAIKLSFKDDYSSLPNAQQSKSTTIKISDFMSFNEKGVKVTKQIQKNIEKLSASKKLRIGDGFTLTVAEFISFKNETVLGDDLVKIINGNQESSKNVIETIVFNNDLLDKDLKYKLKNRVKTSEVSASIKIEIASDFSEFVDQVSFTSKVFSIYGFIINN